MSRRALPLSFLLFASLSVLPCAAQQREEIATRPPTPLSRRELDRREALNLFGQAVEHEHANRLLEALKCCEKALRLDPEATPVLRAVVPLYQALDRQQDAADACRHVVELSPEDFDTWHNYARILRAMDKDGESRKALLRAAACKGLSENPEAHLAVLYDLGAAHEKVGDRKAAEEAFREAVALLERPAAGHEQGGLSREELNTQTADTWERIGRLCIQSKQTDRAVEAFKKAQARDPVRSGRLSFNLAEVLASQRRDAEALLHLDAYLARQPQGLEGYELKLTLLRRTGHADEVVPALERASRADPYHNGLKRMLAHEYVEAGRHADAERTYLSLLASPETETYRGLFELYRRLGRRGAEKLFDRLNTAVEAASPDDQKKVADAGQAAHARAMLAALREQRELVGALLPVAVDRILNGPKPAYRTRVFLAVLAERTRQLDTAEKLYRSCLDDAGRVRQFGIRRNAEADVYGGLLRVLQIGRKYEAVVELCKQGLEHAEATNRVLFHLEQARALMALGKSKESLEASKLAVEIAPDRDRLVCRQSHAGLLAQAGRGKEAEAECTALLKEFKDDADVRGIRFTLSHVYSLARQSERAEGQLKLILDADPSDARANNDLGYLWADQNRKLDEAERMIRKALELDRQQRSTKDALGVDTDLDNAAYVDSLGWVLFRRGRFKEAR